ncbi:MAG: AraC family transcriptional regulator [Amylibacter sp.]|nr:AraC family transcriptional regulator [Amylibacter sp.]
MKSFNTSPFNDALEDLRISGSVLLHETYTPPWRIDIPEEAELQHLLGVSKDVRVLPFHLVRNGAFDLRYEGHKSMHIAKDELVICPSGEAHRMSFGKAVQPVSFAQILEEQSPLPLRPLKEMSGGTELVCGVFQLRSVPLNPLLAALPLVLKVKTVGGNANPMLVHATQMLAMELSNDRRGSFTVSRLLEVFCAEAIRSYRQNSGAQDPGWFKALDDPKIAKALTHVHRHPGEAWTVASLAEKCAMSGSRFAARFRDTTGQSVMSYVARWRMSVACRLLRDTDNNLAAIADEVGYQDLAAFSRAFKELVGESPAKWRIRDQMQCA